MYVSFMFKSHISSFPNLRLPGALEIGCQPEALLSQGALGLEGKRIQQADREKQVLGSSSSLQNWGWGEGLGEQGRVGVELGKKVMTQT